MLVAGGEYNKGPVLKTFTQRRKLTGETRKTTVAFKDWYGLISIGDIWGGCGVGLILAMAPGRVLGPRGCIQKEKQRHRGESGVHVWAAAVCPFAWHTGLVWGE